LTDRDSLLKDWDPSGDRYLRRIRPQDLVAAHDLGRWRPQTGCFCNDSVDEGMSVYSVELLRRLGLDTEVVLIQYPNHFYVEIPASLLTDDEQDLTAILGDDVSDPCREAHVEVKGKKGKKLQKQLRLLQVLGNPLPSWPPET